MQNERPKNEEEKEKGRKKGNRVVEEHKSITTLLLPQRSHLPISHSPSSPPEERKRRDD